MLLVKTLLKAVEWGGGGGGWKERERINYVVHPYTFDSSLQETNFPSVIFIFQFEEEEDEGEEDEVCLW